MRELCLIPSVIGPHARVSTTMTPQNGTLEAYSYNPAEELDKIATTKGATAEFRFDATGSKGSLNADGTVAKFSTVQASGSSFDLTPGKAGTTGTDTYTLDPLDRMTDDVETPTTSQ